MQIKVNNNRYSDYHALSLFLSERERERERESTLPCTSAYPRSSVKRNESSDYLDTKYCSTLLSKVKVLPHNVCWNSAFVPYQVSFRCTHENKKCLFKPHLATRDMNTNASCPQPDRSSSSIVIKQKPRSPLGPGSPSSI